MLFTGKDSALAVKCLKGQRECAVDYFDLSSDPPTSWLARCNLSSGEEEQRCNVISAYVTTRVKTRSFLLLAGFNSLPRFCCEIIWSRVPQRLVHICASKSFPRMITGFVNYLY